MSAALPELGKSMGGTLTYLRLVNPEAAAWFFSRFAAFFSFAVEAAGFFSVFWPRSLDISCPHFWVSTPISDFSPPTWDRCNEI